MGFIAKVKNKFKRAERYAPALACAGMLTAMGAALATGQVSATGEEVNETAEVVKYFGMTMFGWIASALTVIFAGATILFRDFRVAIMTLVMFVATIAVNYLGI